MSDKIAKQSNDIAVPKGYAMEIDKSDVRIPSIVLWQKYLICLSLKAKTLRREIL